MTDKPKFASGGYTGNVEETPIRFDDGCYIPVNPAFTPSEMVVVLANMNGCLVGRHRYAWLNAGGAECYDCGRPM